MWKCLRAVGASSSLEDAGLCVCFEVASLAFNWCLGCFKRGVGAEGLRHGERFLCFTRISVSFCQLLSLTLDGLTGVSQDHMRAHYQTGSNHMMLNVNLWSTLFLGAGKERPAQSAAPCASSAVFCSIKDLGVFGVWLLGAALLMPARGHCFTHSSTPQRELCAEQPSVLPAPAALWM